VRIFLFEDNTRFCALVKDAIHRETSHEVVGTAESATAAKELAQLKPDIVITDLDLLSGTGFDVLWATTSLLHPVITVVLSNHSSDTFRSRAKAFGAAHFFDKSFQWDDFLKFLQSV
jgi:DNA-binding NarL/FixJ family response regulator